MKTYRYTVLLERKTDGGYRASCPTLPGCRAFGDTKREAVQNIKLSIHHRIEAIEAKGKPIPRDGDFVPEYA